MNDEQFKEKVMEVLDEIASAVGTISDRAVRTETRLSKLLIHLGLKADGTNHNSQGNDK